MCGFRAEVRGERLNPLGTKAGVIKHELTELKQTVQRLKAESRGVQRQIKIEERNLKNLDDNIQRKEKLIEKLNKNIAALTSVIEDKRQESFKESRRAEKLKSENKRVEEKRELFNAVAEFFMDPERISGEQLAKIVKILSAAREMRKKHGHLGESMKMTVEARDNLLKMVTGDRYILREEADERLEEQLELQHRKHDSQIDRCVIYTRATREL